MYIHIVDSRRMSTRQNVTRSLALVALLAVTAACGSDDTATRPRTQHGGGRVDADLGRSEQRRRPGDVAARLLPERHPRPGDHRRGRRACSPMPSATTSSSRLSTFNSGHRGDRGDLLRRPRRHLHRPEPGHQRLRPAPTARRCASSPAPPRAARRSSSARASSHRRTSPARSSPRRRSATPRTSRCAPGCSSKGYETDTSGGGDVSITPQDNADTLAAFQSGAVRRRLGARAVGDPTRARRRRPGAGERSRAVARRPVRHHAPDRRDRVPRGAPRCDPAT